MHHFVVLVQLCIGKSFVHFPDSILKTQFTVFLVGLNFLQSFRDLVVEFGLVYGESSLKDRFEHQSLCVRKDYVLRVLSFFLFLLFKG